LVALAAVLTLTTPSISQAQDLTSNDPNAGSGKTNNSAIKDRNIIITANRTEQKVNDTLAAVEIITREDIDLIQPESIVDLLANIAGFDIVRNGGAGQSSSLYSRDKL